MKQNKNTLYNNQILKCLMTGDTFTTQQIADNVGLSEKTVRTRINQLNDWLVEQGLGRAKAGNGNMAGTGRGPENAAVRMAADQR